MAVLIFFFFVFKFNQTVVLFVMVKMMGEERWGVGCGNSKNAWDKETH